ncbi:MAG: hypothetical protein ACNA8W_03435, partial [Bradymonadaceae bacterium]
FKLEAIRRRVGFLDGDRVDGLVRSLHGGGWLNLRASDLSYALAEEGLHLLALLHAADLGNITPANALARAAQNAAFGATLDGAEGSTAYLLDQLLVLLENQVAEARHVLSFGRPFRLIRWSRREHGRQLDIIRGVLGALQERMDAASREFTRIVRIHEAMQEIIKAHTSIHGRLKEWNLDRLYTSDAGYSISQLVEAVLGCDDETLEEAVMAGLIQGPVLPPDLTADEMRMRFHAARRSLPTQVEPFVYRPPEEPERQVWSPAELDPAVALRHRLSAALSRIADEGRPLILEDWIEAEGFAAVSYELATLCRLCSEGDIIALEDGRRARVRMSNDLTREIAPARVLASLEEAGALRHLEWGWFSDLRIHVEIEAEVKVNAWSRQMND